jgi:glycosyltransferase involved in cell wall biosynthesis
VSAPLRVLWLIKGLGPGGAEQLLVNQARAGDARFAFSAAYLLPWKNHLVESLEAEGVMVTCLDGRREWDPRWAIRLRRLLRRGHFDVVHTHSPYVAAATRVVVGSLPRSERPALVYTEHNQWPRYRLTTRWANRLSYGLDQAHVAVSNDVRQSVPARWRDGVEVLVHGIHLESVAAQADHRAAMRAELGVADDEVVIGTVANLVVKKDYPTLLAAAAEVLARDDQRRVRYVAVGQGPLEDEVRREHRALGLGERFALLGYRPDATRVMSAFDIFTLASRHEGLPVALMDALALGLPVVATDVGGIPQAVTDGEQGTLVAPGRPDLLAKAQEAMAADADLRARYGAAARAASSAFDIGRAADRLGEIYVAAAGARNPARDSAPE